MSIKVRVIEKHYHFKNILIKLKPYLKDIINNLKKSDTRQIQLTLTINFISSKDDNDKEHVIDSESYNIEIMLNDEADKL